VIAGELIHPHPALGESIRMAAAVVTQVDTLHRSGLSQICNGDP
jgi:hypothetical protein